jgi:hypothetical protein
MQMGKRSWSRSRVYGRLARALRSRPPDPIDSVFFYDVFSPLPSKTKKYPDRFERRQIKEKLIIT